MAIQRALIPHRAWPSSRRRYSRHRDACTPVRDPAMLITSHNAPRSSVESVPESDVMETRRHVGVWGRPAQRARPGRRLHPELLGGMDATDPRDLSRVAFRTIDPPSNAMTTSVPDLLELAGAWSTGSTRVALVRPRRTSLRQPPATKTVKCRAIRVTGPVQRVLPVRTRRRWRHAVGDRSPAERHRQCRACLHLSRRDLDRPTVQRPGGSVEGRPPQDRGTRRFDLCSDK